MSQQNVVRGYYCTAEFWRVDLQGSLKDGKEVELTLSLLFDRSLFEALNGFVV